jgi:hypothetical protein
MKKVVLIIASLGLTGLVGYFVYKKVKSPIANKTTTGSDLEKKADINKVIGTTPDGRTIYKSPSNGKPTRSIYKELGYFADGTPVDFSDIANPNDPTNQPLD